MDAKFVAYNHVPLGFEMIIEENQVKAYNLWWNTKVTDDPEAWDDEIRMINEMQDRLGGLTRDQRLIRAQIAEFCRLSPVFPQSIDILSREIGDDHFSKRVLMGCEGRGLLDSLGCRSSEDQWKDILAEYARSVKKWLEEGQPEDPRDSKVFGFLQQPTEPKVAFIEKVISVIDTEEPSVSSLRRVVEGEHEAIRGSLGDIKSRPFNCFTCQAGCLEGTTVPECQCSISMILDSGLLLSGASGEKGLIHGNFRHFIEENILSYCLSINSWLTGLPVEQVSSPLSGHYVTEDDMPAIAESIYSSLGERDSVKEWLAACLLKTIKDNQRWHKTTELIDDFWEVSSWLREKLS